jgi:rhodanese-related sulfurtransferase
MFEFTLNTPMKEVETRFPFSKSLLHAKFHVGGCAACGYEPNETIAEVATKHSKDAESMVEALNEGLGEMNSCEISVQSLASIINSPKRTAKLLILDVREPWEYDVVHLPGSTLLTSENMAETLEAAKETPHVVVICHHGLRSLNATLFFRQNGVAQALSLRGGIDLYAVEIDSTLQRY